MALPDHSGMKLSRYLLDSLDMLGIGACEYDAGMMTLAWNRTFLRFFPEDEDLIFVGEAYRENLKRFYLGRLTPEEMPEIDRYVEEGVARHLNQMQPFEFRHNGRHLRASSLRAPDGGRVRMWQCLEDCRHPSQAPDFALAIIDALPFIPDGVTILDASDRIIAANRAFSELYELPPDDIVVGRTLDEIVAWCWRDGSPSGSWRAAIRNGLRYDGAPFEIELPGQRWLRVVARHSADGVGFFTHADITAAKRQEMALLEAQEALRQANAVLALLADTDVLTGLPNRRRFVTELGRAVGRAQPVALLVIDVDHFKAINDRFGHLTGDSCLKMIAEVLDREFAETSTLVARLGGEEFGVLLGGKDLETAYATGLAIRGALRSADWARLNPDLPGVTVSIGLCAAEGPLEGTRLYACADDALYAAKRNGRDRIEISDLRLSPWLSAG
jgi:diguanylate cyclase (GGDEF)-like protein